MDHNKAPLHVYLRSFLIENATLCNQWWYIIHRFHKHLLPSVRGWITPPPNHRWIKTLVFNSPQGCHFPGTHLSGGNTEHCEEANISWHTWWGLYQWWDEGAKNNIFIVFPCRHIAAGRGKIQGTFQNMESLLKTTRPKPQLFDTR